MFFLNQRKNFYNSPNIHYFFSYTISPILILFTANKRVSNFINRFISVWWTSIIPKKKREISKSVNSCVIREYLYHVEYYSRNRYDNHQQSVAVYREAFYFPRFQNNSQKWSALREKYTTAGKVNFANC